MTKLRDLVERAWYGNALPWTGVFRPLESLFIHRVKQRMAGKNQVPALACPVVVVGNISVGGTGKTPVVLALVEQLQAMGKRPGIISRGYGGQCDNYPLLVTPATAVAQCGDEAKLLALRSGVPLVVDPDRNRAAQTLLDQHSVDVIISDDGLQHYRLYRNLEIVVVDGERLFGNGHCLPVGPLREPLARLDTVDLVLINGGQRRACATDNISVPYESFKLTPVAWVNLRSGQRMDLNALDVNCHYQALAGIGNPQRFFDTLTSLGVEYSAHTFADHHAYSAQDLQPWLDQPLLMTEKDAVKCQPFASDQWWYLQVSVAWQGDAQKTLEACLSAL